MENILANDWLSRFQMGPQREWLYTHSRSIKSMGAKPSVWTRHLFVGDVSRCGSVHLSRLQRGYADAGQGGSRVCKRCQSSAPSSDTGANQ